MGFNILKFMRNYSYFLFGEKGRINKRAATNDLIIQEAFYNGITNKAIDYIADNVSQIPVKFKYEDGKEVSDPDLKKIKDIMNRNKVSTMQNLIYDCIADKYYFGDYGVKYVRAGGRIVATQHIGSNHLTIDFKESINVLENPIQKITVSNNGNDNIPPGDFLFVSTYNPEAITRNTSRGVAKVKPPLDNIIQINEANGWNLNLFKNNLIAAGMFKAKDKLTQTQYDRLKDQINEDFTGKRNSNKPMLMEGGMEFEDMQKDPKEANYGETIADLRRYVSTDLGVPSELMGDTKSKTFASFKEARTSFYEETAVPEAEEFWENYSKPLSEALGKTIIAEVDRDQIPALQEDAAKKWERIDKSKSLKLNEKRTELGFEDVKGGDVILVSSSDIPLDFAGEEE